MVRHGPGDGSYDYDCSGAEEEHWSNAGNCGIGICILTEGWQGAIPSCGTEAQYVTSCGGLASRLAQTTPRTQECH